MRLIASLIAAVILLSPSPAYAIIGTADVTEWWDFQEGTGSTITGERGSYNLGLAAGATWTTGGPTNLPNGIDYDGGANGYTENATDFDVSSGALCVWIDADSTADGYFGNGNGGGEFDIFFESNNLKSRSRVGGADSTITSSTVPSTDTKYHVCYNFQSGARELFLNGSSVGTANTAGAFNDTGHGLVFGRNASKGGGAFNGQQYQAIFFNRILTGTEISALYNAGAGCKHDDFSFTTNACGGGTVSFGWFWSFFW